MSEQSPSPHRGMGLTWPAGITWPSALSFSGAPKVLGHLLGGNGRGCREVLTHPPASLCLLPSLKMISPVNRTATNKLPRPPSPAGRATPTQTHEGTSQSPWERLRGPAPQAPCQLKSPKARQMARSPLCPVIERKVMQVGWGFTSCGQKLVPHTVLTKQAHS